MTSALVNTVQRSSSSAFTSLKFNTIAIFVFGWDTLLFLFSAIAPRKAPGKITHYGGKWPEYIAPKAGDSRSACPALNALANHGIFPHSGRGITFVELNKHLGDSYNLAPTFSWFLPNYIAQILCRNYNTDTFNLEDLSVHNGIEHDGSLTREDTYFVADQGTPSPILVNKILSSGTGPHGKVEYNDLARALAKRRVEARATNTQFSSSLTHKLFGSSNAATMITHFGGKLADLKSFLIEERLPDGWEPACRDATGLTMLKFNSATVSLEMLVDEGEFNVKKD